MPLELHSESDNKDKARVATAFARFIERGSKRLFVFHPLCSLLLCLVGAVVLAQAGQAVADNGDISGAVAELVDSAIDTEDKQYMSLTDREKDIVLMEGDSWFDLPWWDTDLEDVLRDAGYTVLSVADAGDTLENMAFNGQLTEIASELRRLAHLHRTPRAILLSVGGNDIIGPSFVTLLNHSKSSLGHWNSTGALNVEILNPIIDRFYSYVVDYVSAISLLCYRFYSKDNVREYVNYDGMGCGSIPIILHGYDYPIPSGDGYRILGLFGVKGPWLRPAFEMKGQKGMADMTQVLEHILDKFNKALKDATENLDNSSNIHNPVCYLRLIGIVRSEGNWADEVHPDKDAMWAIGAEFKSKIEGDDCS